ncbi:MAG: sulfite dehydrogenase [Granulosicoccus sp.]|nr:sulfite dehydrogenase [Granulosicoccus sp.]
MNRNDTKKIGSRESGVVEPYEARERSVQTGTRRGFLQKGTAGLAALGMSTSLTANTPSSWKVPGGEFSNYGAPHPDQDKVIRWISQSRSVAGEGVSWTPLQDLEGIITPNGLHFERHHNGIPDVDTTRWEVAIHGLVDNPVAFDLEALKRYPMTSRITFIECGGNSNSLWHPTPVQAPVGYAHGLISCSEWTGVRLGLLLEEAGLHADGLWLIADGLDSAGVSVSLPLTELPEDTLIALYQNGEALRPANGYPARLLIPGWEGITHVKWLRSLQVSAAPLMSRFDTVSYTDLHKDGIAERFSFEMKIKSVITSPTPGKSLRGPGFHEISGLAWTGNGKVRQVDISVDRGLSWHSAELQEPVLDKALTRFRLPWEWDGTDTVLQSRAMDHTGRMQPTREALIAAKGSSVYYHYNAIVSWAVDKAGNISHVYV